jgi:hypothetical protein
MVRNLLPESPATPVLRKSAKFSQTGIAKLTSHLPAHKSREINAT